MEESVDIGKNLIPKALISLILMFPRDLRRLGLRGRERLWLLNLKCLVMRLNIRYVDWPLRKRCRAYDVGWLSVCGQYNLLYCTVPNC